MTKFSAETNEVLRAIAEARNRGDEIALATIVEVSGSTYRRPGARLLVTKTGAMVGNLSGGCLEGEVEQVARTVMESGAARLEHYDLTADDEVVWGWGLGCNGAIDVFIEPGELASGVAETVATAIEEERSLVAVTVIESDATDVALGARLIVTPDGDRRGSLGAPALDQIAAGVAVGALQAGATEVRLLSVDDYRVRAFFEVIEPPLRLLICGAGHDAIPFAAAASGLGWRVVVADDRSAMLSDSRFPTAEFVKCRPSDVAVAAGVDDRTYVTVMSHNYLRDRDYLKSLYSAPAPYIGMLGPRARTERLLGDLAAEGIHPSDDERARIHGPAGLDLGAEGPEEIAAAIIGEILAVSRNRTAGFLRDRADSIHPRPEAVRSP